MVTLLGGIFELVARGLVVIALASPFGYLGICFANPLAWIFALIPLIPAYYRRMKRMKFNSIIQE